MRQMQLDNSSEIAKLLVPKLLKIDIADQDVRDAQELLEGWDYTQDADSAAAAYFNAVWRNILKLAFGNKLPKELRVKGQCLWVDPVEHHRARGRRPSKVRECGQRDADQAQPDGGDRWFEVVRTPDGQTENSDWWTTPDSGARDGARPQPRRAVQAGHDRRPLGADRQARQGHRHLELGPAAPPVPEEPDPRHRGPRTSLQYMLNRGPWKLSGGEATVNATGWNAAGGYGVVWVPSMRMVVNLGDLDKSRWINLTGASGHAYSAHYTDQTDKWADGELLPLVLLGQGGRREHERHPGAQAVSR